jgi:hypothetical protein
LLEIYHIRTTFQLVFLGLSGLSIPDKDEKNSRQTKRSQWNRPVPHQYPALGYAGMIPGRENTG